MNTYLGASGELFVVFIGNNRRKFTMYIATGRGKGDRAVLLRTLRSRSGRLNSFGKDDIRFVFGVVSTARLLPLEVLPNSPDDASQRQAKQHAKYGCANR